jgi:hypothetical protein
MLSGLLAFCFGWFFFQKKTTPSFVEKVDKTTPSFVDLIMNSD